jgi:hypothetical protein
MLGGLFPKTIDNDYRGRWLALVFFLPILAMKSIIGVNISGLNPYVTTERILKSADGVPLDLWPSDAVQQIVFSSAAWGAVMLILCLFSFLALVRYRALLPLLILMFFAEQATRKWIAIAAFGAPDPAAPHALGFYINWGFTIALGVAFILSLAPRKR